MKLTRAQIRKLIKEQIEIFEEDEKSQLSQKQMAGAISLDPEINQELLKSIREIVASEIGKKLGDYVSKGVVHRNAVRKNLKAMADAIDPSIKML